MFGVAGLQRLFGKQCGRSPAGVTEVGQHGGADAGPGLGGWA